MAIVLFVDGGCSGNDTKDIAKRRMVAVVTDDLGMVISEQRSAGGSNNIAELLAVHDALQWCDANGITDVELFTDSRNNESWVFGKKLGKKLNDRERVVALRQAIDAYRRTITLTLTWIPRDMNLAGHYIETEYGL
jgi:ribonuclease HI